jgi:hypothetical protein
MKTKIVLLSALFLLGCLSASLAQNIPSYIPTNGLVGWYPFNGNANDESGNGNNCTVVGATLTTDRFSISGKAYNFNGTGDYIYSSELSSELSTKTFSAWVKLSTLTQGGGSIIGIEKFNEIKFDAIVYNEQQSGWGFGSDEYSRSSWSNVNETSTDWIFMVAVYENNNYRLFRNNVLLAETQSFPAYLFSSGSRFNIGLRHTAEFIPQNGFLNGQIDDIAIWNRALTQQEITNLYNASSCANNLSISPANPSQSTGSNAALNASTSDPNPSFVWQSDLGLGFQNLSNYGQYSGVNTDSLVVSDLQLRNHQQAFRVISTSGNCVDTSAVATISLTDTCLFTQYESVTTDTIRILVTGMNPADYLNTIRIYPNPATQGTQLKIDFGNFSVMDGYQLRIENALGQQVFQTSIDNPGDTVNLSSLGGSGVYFVRILNPLGNTSVLRKILLQ